MVKRTCTKCGVAKPPVEFYRNTGVLMGACKECTKAAVARHRRANVEKIRKYDRERSARPERIKRVTANTKRWRARGPAARAAHSLVSRALTDGRLRRGSCEVCGSLRAEHHKQWHLANGPGANAEATPPRRRAA